jgi:hypothetical protein
VGIRVMPEDRHIKVRGKIEKGCIFRTTIRSFPLLIRHTEPLSGPSGGRMKNGR